MILAHCAAIGYILLTIGLASPEGSAMVAGNSPSSYGLPVEKIITPEDVRSILAIAKKHSERDHLFFCVAANTGLRLSEVGHLMVDDVLSNNRLLVTRRKKKELRPEIIDVAAPIHAMLVERAKQYECGYLFPGRCAPCFIRHRSKPPEQFCIGGHTSLRDIQRRWSLTIAEAGLLMRGRGIHSLRHTAITSVYNTTRDILKAQIFAGHSSPTITMSYAHVLDMQETLAKMPVVK